jgi:hypothetical protein
MLTKKIFISSDLPRKKGLISNLNRYSRKHMVLLTFSSRIIQLFYIIFKIYIHRLRRLT